MTKNRYLLHQKITDLYNQSCRMSNQQSVTLSDLTRLSKTADDVQDLVETLLTAAYATRSKTL